MRASVTLDYTTLVESMRSGHVHFGWLTPSPLVLAERLFGVRVLLTRRTETVGTHKGQISFPGGRAEPDDPSIHHTALREAEEEIGLAAEKVEILGELDQYITVTGYRVTPVVGLIQAPFDLQLDSFEVAEAFEVPISILMDPHNHSRNRVVQNDRERYYYAVPFGRHYIWGATAGMLMNFHRYLSAE